MSTFMLTGIKELVKNLGDIVEKENRKGIVAMEKGCIEVENEAKRSMGTGPQYKEYKVSKTGASHWSSSPGYPPNILTGRLRASMAHRISGKPYIPSIYRYSGTGGEPGGSGKTNLSDPHGSFMVFTGHVGTDVEYARDLEKGKRRVLARPFLLPALEKSRNKILEIFKDYLGF